MRRKITIITAIALISFSGCSEAPAEEYVPLMGLEWFTEYDAVKAELSTSELISEREDNSTIPQKMQDYADMQLFDINCDLTLCFTDSGLIGFNYHDTKRNQSYRKWFGMIESEYGIPDEQGNGMASWYDDPVGKNTAVYLFNLQDEVQISFYATADSPDRSYKKKRERQIPSPELRSPVVPVEETERTSEVTETVTVITETVTAESTQYREYYEDDTDVQPMEQSAETTTTATTTETVETSAVTTTAKPDRTNDYKLGGLEFYGSPESECSKMDAYTQLYEYRTEEAGQPWEHIIEYGGVQYLGNDCEAVLCFTSRGLVGISFFDERTDSYDYWMEQFKDIYGESDEVQYNYSAWEEPVGQGTTVYVFAIEDGVQISFFADDSGSESAK